MPYIAYLLAGPSHSPSDLLPIPPNPPPREAPTHISPTTRIRVHVRDFSGQPAPTAESDGSREYFSHRNHRNDLFSLHFFFTPPEDIPGDELVLSNTFSRPIRQQLPYFFPAAWKALKWVDPGIEGDVYSDTPEVFGHVLGSVNYLSCPPHDSQQKGDVDGDGDLGTVIEEQMPADVPKTPAERRKHFLVAERRKRWVWLKGREYRWDFCNGMINLNDFSLRIPGLGFKINMFRYWDGQPLRFELKNKRTGDVYGVVQIELRGAEDERGMTVNGTVVDDGASDGISETEVDRVV